MVNEDDPFYVGDIARSPDGYEAVLEKGWPSVAAMSGSIHDPASVQYRNISIPAFFQITIRPESPADDAEWAAVLLFTVDADLERIELRGALSIKVDVDQALDRAKAARSISGWTQWALVTFALGPHVDQGPLSTEAMQEILSQFASVAGYRSKRGRDRITDETLERVAQVYREAWQRGDNPTAAVAEAFHKARSTAATYVGLARRKQYLGPANGSRGGELPTK